MRNLYVVLAICWALAYR